MLKSSLPVVSNCKNSDIYVNDTEFQNLMYDDIFLFYFYYINKKSIIIENSINIY